MNYATKYGVTLHSAPAGPAWRAVEIRHLSPSDNRGSHAVFVDVVDGAGGRVRDKALGIGYTWDGALLTPPPKPLDKPDGPMERGHGNLDIYKHQTLSLWITGDGLASDLVTGIHSRHDDEPGPNGELWNTWGHHSFYVKFQRSQATTFPEWTGHITATSGLNFRIAPATTSPVIRTLAHGSQVTITGPQAGDWLPARHDGQAGFLFAAYVSQGPTTDPNFDRAVAWVLQVEGGYTSGIPGDPGGETNHGISKRSYPALDIKNLTRAQAIEIFRRDYWHGSGANVLPWPLCLVQLDSAVQHGSGIAKQLLAESQGDMLRYMGKRLEYYANIPHVATFAKPWGRRVGNLLVEASK